MKNEDDHLAACIPDYDSGCINDFGGGNVGWWQDYIRGEVQRCNDYWRSQIAQLEADKSAAAPEQHEETTR